VVNARGEAMVTKWWLRIERPAAPNDGRPTKQRKGPLKKRPLRF